MTLFQSAMGLRHSDMRRATWRLEGTLVNGKDERILKGTTSKISSAPKPRVDAWHIGDI